MPTKEEIELQRRLLEVHRRNLYHLLVRKAQFGADFVPSTVIHGIEETRQSIARSKAMLRDWGVVVEDYPDDEVDEVSHTYIGSPMAHTSMPYSWNIFGILTRFILLLSIISILYVLLSIISILYVFAPYPILIRTDLAQRVSSGWLLVGVIILATIGIAIRLRPVLQGVRTREQTSTVRAAIGFTGITLFLFFAIVQILALTLPAPVQYVLGNSEPATQQSTLSVWLFFLLILLVSAVSGVLATRARRLSQALSVVLAGIVLCLAIMLTVWNTSSAQASERPSIPELAVASYRADLQIDGPRSIRMWSSAPITLTLSVITNTVDTAWPLTHAGPYTATVAIQENTFSLAKNIDKIQQPQLVSFGSPATWIWGIEPNDPYYDEQLMIFNLTMADKGGVVIAPYRFLYITVTFFGFPGWIRLLGLGLGGLLTVIGAKELYLKFIPERQAAPKQEPASPAPVPVAPPAVSAEAMRFVPPAAAPPPQTLESKPKGKKPPKS